MTNTHDNRTAIANLLLDDPKYRATIQDILTDHFEQDPLKFETIVEYLTEQKEI